MRSDECGYRLQVSCCRGEHESGTDLRVAGCRVHVAEENMKVVKTYRLQVAGFMLHRRT